MNKLMVNVVGLATLLTISVATGTEITVDQAKKATANWAKRSAAISGNIATVETLSDAETSARVHVASFADGGFVVMAADDDDDPIIAFSTRGDSSVVKDGPIWDLLRMEGSIRKRSANVSGMATASRQTTNVATQASSSTRSAKMKWNVLLSEEYTPTNNSIPSKSAQISNSGRSKMFYPCVYNLLKTHWGQSGVGNLLCYNMYTPTQTVSKAASAVADGYVADSEEDMDGIHAPCGCVATAGAQVMKYFEYPTSRIPPTTFACKAFGNSVYLTTRGEKYRWSDMPDWPDTATPESHRSAIGTLTYDVGVACHASYYLGCTSASAYNLSLALVDTFGYSQAVYFDFYNSSSLSRTEDNFKHIVIPNLISERPVLLSIQGDSGHEIVIDGYGYDKSYGDGEEDCYVHMNFGWTGSCDLWFRPPMSSDPIVASSRRYNYFDSIIGNIFTSGSGSLVAGRVMKADEITGENYPWYNVKVCLSGQSAVGLNVSKETRTDAEGQYSFVVAPGKYSLFAYNENGPYQSGRYSIDVGECSRNSIGNVLLDIQLDEDAVVATPDIDEDKLLQDIIDVSCSMKGATIRYTNDGTDPTLLSSLYTSPIHVWKTGEYRFAAFIPGMARSAIRSVSLTIAKWKTDSFDSADAITGDSGVLELSNEDAGREEGEPVHCGYTGGASVWVSFTPATSGDYTFYASGLSVADSESVLTMLAAYTGDAVGELTEIASDMSSDSCISLHAEAGVTYHLALDTYKGEKSILTLSWEPGFKDTLEVQNCGAFASVDGSIMRLGLMTTAEWNVANFPPWISFDQNSGEPGDDLVYRVARNSTGQVRSGTVVLAAGNADPASIIVTQGTLKWFTNRVEAINAARVANKPILLVVGREICSNTRETMFTSCETSPLRERLNNGYILWFCNGDKQYWESDEYFEGTNYGSYPSVCVIDPDAPETCLARTGGYQTVSALTTLLDKAAKTPALSILAGDSVSSVTLSWTAIAGASKYIVYRGDSQTSLTAVAKDVTSLSYVDTTVSSGSKYYYAVEAVVGAVAQGVSVPVCFNNVASVYFDKNDGSDAVVWQYDFDDSVWQWTPRRDGYRFDGWFTAKDGGERCTFPFTITTRSVRMYAHWTPYKFRVELIAPGVIFERTKLALVATVTNVTTETIVVTNTTKWTVVSGTAAKIDSTGVLTPVSTTGSVTISAQAKFWGVDFARTMKIDVARASDIRSFVIEGPEVVDLYDVVCAQYKAKVTLKNGNAYAVQPTWSVAESAVTNAVINANGYVSFPYPSLYRKASALTVSARYRGMGASFSSSVWGWYAELVAWSCDSRVLYPGYSGCIVPAAIRWWRHGILENATTDLSGVRLVVSAGWINNSTLFNSSTDDAAFSIPVAVTEEDGFAYPWACIEAERLGRTSSFDTACWMDYVASKPASMISVKFNAEGGFPATQTTRYVANQEYCQMPIVVKNGYSFSGWYTARQGGRRVYSGELITSGVRELYARWTPAISSVKFVANGGAGMMSEITVTNFSVMQLPKCLFSAPKGKRFAGWACSNGRRYDDGMLVFNLAQPGETVTMTAIWK